MRARYLLRFDDLCPTMNWAAWEPVEAALREAGVKPVLAVVPDNRDEGLRVAPARPDFWERVRRWQGLGWAIGLHGYRHLYVTRDAGLLGLNARSEFAGLPREEQERKLRAALAIFAAEGVRPQAWVAPAHSFDEVTLGCLAELGIPVVSDGFSIFPYRDARGILWVPQQLWRFRAMPLGVWTVCFHVNAWGDEEVARFRRDLRVYREAVVGLEDVAAAYGDRRPGALDALAKPVWRGALRLRRLVRGLGR